MTTKDEPLWRPTAAGRAGYPLTRFAAAAEALTRRSFADYDALHGWSLEDAGAFWNLVWDFAGIIGDKGAPVITDGEKMPGARFFPNGRLNFAENLLRRRDESDALVFWGEDRVRRRLSWPELHDLVSRLQQAFRDLGVGPGDRVAAMLPNLPETIAAMLATASLGAVWSSASPDFGARGVLDRFGQIAPKLFIACDGYFYGGKEIRTSPRNSPRSCPASPACGRRSSSPISARRRASLPGSPMRSTSRRRLHLTRRGRSNSSSSPADHPLYVLFSSGTTGVPKCIVHSAGGTLIEHVKELRLHSGIERGDRVFYFTTCGWMMWNWLASALACEATLLLYDGSPFHPSPAILFEFARTRAGDVLRHLGEVHRRVEQVRLPAARPPRPLDDPDDRLDRLAARARGLRLRL